MLVICYLFCVCVCRLKAQQSLCCIQHTTMPTLIKAYLFIHLHIFISWEKGGGGRALNIFSIFYSPLHTSSDS